jgi:hypothetical protein
MKKLILGITSFVFIASSFSSCTIEKRVHQEGYHVSWKHKHASASEIKSTQIDNSPAIISPILHEEITPNVHSVETISASNSENIVISIGIFPASRAYFLLSNALFQHAAAFHWT